MDTILVTGCAGFIGSSLVDRLLTEKYFVVGLDNFNDYYDPKIKEENIKEALSNKNFKLFRVDICDSEKLSKIFRETKPKKIVHLAARAGVRPSILDPLLYAKVNVGGTVNLLKLACENNVEQFIFGSSSSVYGESKKLPFREDDPCENIVSPYGASKRAAEFFVESFHHSHGLKAVILRFFTVYGERSRPDMAPALFAKAILEGSEIKQFGDGNSSRDYTHVDDVCDAILRILEKDIEFEILNIGNNNPVKLSQFISLIEKVSGKNAKISKRPAQKGDVSRTWANIEKARKLLEWEPKTNIEKGLSEYINWLKFKVV